MVWWMALVDLAWNDPVISPDKSEWQTNMESNGNNTVPSDYRTGLHPC